MRRMLRFVNPETRSTRCDRAFRRNASGVGIARALIGDPKCTVDEPTAGLDPPTSRTTASCNEVRDLETCRHFL